MSNQSLRAISLVRCQRTTIAFDNATFDVASTESQVTVTSSPDDYVVVRRSSQSLPYEASVESSVVVTERKVGKIDLAPYLLIHWEDEMSAPHVHFRTPPREVRRWYEGGQSIELGLEEITQYRIIYRDGVEATIRRVSDDRFEFSFSTGFYGSCWRDPDGSYTIHFKGDRLPPAEESYRSQSKFIVSRSKYSGNLLLILQDAAEVVVS